MEALRYTGKTNKLEYVEIPVPKIAKPDDVLIKVAYSGVCGTDLHIIAGEFPAVNPETTTLGHEFSGIVVDVGSDVRNVKKGDKVAVDPNDGCRCCDFCHSGKPHYCISGRAEKSLGTVKNGAFSTYALMPMNIVYKLPESATLEQGALAEPLSCLSHGWDLLTPIPVGSRILIMGAGIIGNLWVCLLHLQGHRNVTVSEPNQTRLDYVKKLETGFTLLTPDQLKQNGDSDPGYLFDVIIDCSGYCPAIQRAIGLLNKGGRLCCFGVASAEGRISGYCPAIQRAIGLLNKGGRLCCFGVASAEGRISISPFELFAKELSILAVNVNPFSMVKALGFIEAMGSRYIDYEKLGIQVFSLKDYENALEQLKSGKIAKAMFKFEL